MLYTAFITYAVVLPKTYRYTLISENDGVILEGGTVRKFLNFA